MCLDCVRLDELFYIVEDVQLYEEGVKQNVRGLVRDSNPGPRAPEARIIPLDQRAGVSDRRSHFRDRSKRQRCYRRNVE